MMKNQCVFNTVSFRKLIGKIRTLTAPTRYCDASVSCLNGSVSLHMTVSRTNT